MRQQKQNLSLYRIPQIQNCQKVQSYPITLIDGTGSMGDEYESIISAHEQSFKCFGQNQLTYQFEQQLFPPKPFRSAAKGHISNIFKSIFEKLLNSDQYPKNLTFIFVSDGQEPYDFNHISDLIRRMKEKYLMQFVSVAVGDQFPNNISNDLRNQIHNQNSNCPPLFYIKRQFIYNRPKQEIFQEFLEVFEAIKNSIQVYQDYFEVSTGCYSTLGQQQTSTKIQPLEIVAAYSHFNEINVDNSSLIHSNDVSTLNEMLGKTIQQDILIPCAQKTEQQIIDASKLIQMRVKEITLTIQPRQCEQILVKLNFIDQCADGNLLPTKLTELEKTHIQSNLESGNLFQIVDDLIKKYNQSLKQQQKVFKTALKNPNCTIRSQAKLKPAQNVEKVVTDNLLILKKLLESNERVDLKEELEELKTLIESALQEVQNLPDDSRESCICKKKIVEFIKLLDQLMIKLKDKNFTRQDIVSLISQFMKLKDEIKDPFPQQSQDPYYQKYLSNQFSLNQEIYEMEERVKHVLQFNRQNDDKYIIEQFEMILRDCLSQCRRKIFLLCENCKDINVFEVKTCIKDAIAQMSFFLPYVFGQLKISFPRRNYESFRRVVATLCHVDQQMFQNLKNNELKQYINIIDDCLLCRGFIKDFVESIETVACCDYDYLYRPKYIA